MNIRINKNGRPVANKNILEDLTLANLRSTLIKDGIKEDDTFLDAKSYPIKKPDEKTFKVSDVAGVDEVISIISLKKPVQSNGTARAVGELMSKLKKSSFTHDMAPKAIDNFTESQTRDLSDVILSSGLDSTGSADDPMALDYQEWQYLFEKNSLLSGININEDIPRRSWAKICEPRNGIPKFMHWDVPTVTASSTYSERSNNYVRSKFIHAEATVSHPFASGSVEGEIKERKMSQRESKKLFMTGESNFPRVLVRLYKEDVVLSDEFVAEVDNALSAFSTNRQDCYTRLKKVFNKFGHVWPTEIQLGGQLQVTQTKEISGSFDSRSAERDLKVAVAGRMKAFSGSAATSISTASDNKENAVDELQNKDFTAYGGNTLLAQDSAAWVSSLTSYKSWSVIEMSKIIPSYKLLDDERIKQIDDILAEFEVTQNLSSFRLRLGDLISLECGDEKFLHRVRIGGSKSDRKLSRKQKKQRGRFSSRNVIYNNATAKIREARFIVSTLEKEDGDDKISLETLDGKGYLTISKSGFLVYGEKPTDKAAIPASAKFIVDYLDDNGTVALMANNDKYLCNDGTAMRFKGEDSDDATPLDVIRIDEF